MDEMSFPEELWQANYKSCDRKRLIIELLRVLDGQLLDRKKRAEFLMQEILLREARGDVSR